MKTSVLLTIIIALTIIACDKGKFETVPQIKVKSKNTDVVPFNGNLRVTLEYTDKEGDVDDSLLIVRERLNKRGPIRLPASPYKIPTFPDIDEGEFEVNFRYNFDLTVGLSPLRIPGSNPAQFEPDTMLLKFVARDKAGNKSDTASTDVIVNRQ
jgi:hypothetical protein